jgi:hypothetical protein
MAAKTPSTATPCSLAMIRLIVLGLPPLGPLPSMPTTASMMESAGARMA